MRRLWLTLAVALALAAGYLGWYAGRGLDPGEGTYVVKPGARVRTLARELSARGALPESNTFVLLAYLTGHARDLKVGEYRFKRGMSALAILEQVAAGRVVEYPIVLVEGWSFRQLRQALAEAPKLGQTLRGLNTREIMARLGRPDEHPEGRFFPDTYSFTAGHTDLLILRRAYERMQQRLKDEWEARAPNLPLRDPYEALILASIVEKETGRADERPLIAAVFTNRLRRNMRLQTDPTVIYGLGERFDGNLRLSDLRTDGPYNTYTRAGLPPTPIAMPGAAALHATLHPAETRALYFVARGDGSHVFSETLAEHNQAVVQYQLGGRPRAPATGR
jgi:UPF0755 protein